MSSSYNVMLKERKLPLFLLNDHQKVDDFEEKYAENAIVEGSEEDGFRDLVRHTMFEKGQSKRIWGELYKVIDSSDVVVQVLARCKRSTRNKVLPFRETFERALQA
ncbi:nucleolar GTP-binding protein 2 [Cucumis melo var. makuwa]|uniref:Nucleolar GTP-binding protein 2 n=1 Tax=Cucumis melo var. makuwa TaxID=1194695 RepID=A0A5A7UKS7_CUCMM|nr:nucleolar GTP-binding protein 2 [Cucumis melo var. makuwa]